MKKSYAVIRIDDKTLSVKFNSKKFWLILERWKKEFPQAEWHQTHRAWELPISNFEKVRRFCDDHFLKVKIQPLQEQAVQLKLNFN